MNKFLAILGIIVLTGAGCASTVETKPVANSDTTTDTSKTTNAGLTVKQNTNDTTQVVDAGGGVELTVEPVKTDATTDSSVDDNTIDIVLGEDTSQTVEMETANFSFSPKIISAKPGDKIKIAFKKNSGFHTFVIDELNLKQAINEGESLVFTAPKTPGTYAFYCDIGSHRSMGMEGSLIIK